MSTSPPEVEESSAGIDSFAVKVENLSRATAEPIKITILANEINSEPLIELEECTKLVG